MYEQERDFVFSCPACGAPSARPVERDVDAHAGAIYTCDQCGERVSLWVTVASAPAEVEGWEEVERWFRTSGICAGCGESGLDPTRMSHCRAGTGPGGEPTPVQCGPVSVRDPDELMTKVRACWPASPPARPEAVRELLRDIESPDWKARMTPEESEVCAMYLAGRLRTALGLPTKEEEHG